MTTNNTPRQNKPTVGFWNQNTSLLAPTPILPHPHHQLNAPLGLGNQRAFTAPEEELTSDLHFPVRLHYMLTDIHKDGLLTNIVSWQPHGR